MSPATRRRRAKMWARACDRQGARSNRHVVEWIEGVEESIASALHAFGKSGWAGVNARRLESRPGDVSRGAPF